MTKQCLNKEMYLKDAPEHVTLLLQNYIKIKIGVELPANNIIEIFNDTSHTWGYFNNYTFSDNKAAIMDSADVESINCWLWARVMGYAFPDRVSGSDVAALKNKLSHPHLLNNLYKLKDVNNHSQKLKITEVNLALLVDFLYMPEEIKLKGSHYVLDAIQEVLAENKSSFETKVKRNLAAI